MNISIAGADNLNIKDVKNISGSNSAEILESDLIFIFPESNYQNAMKVADVAKLHNILTIGIAPKGIPINFKKAVDAWLTTDDKDEPVNIIRAITDLINCDGFVKIELDDVAEVFKKAGKIIVGTGCSNKIDRAQLATNEALQNLKFDNAKKILINITTGSNVSLNEMTEAAGIIESCANPDVDILWGHIIDEDFGQWFKITVIAILNQTN